MLRSRTLSRIWQCRQLVGTLGIGNDPASGRPGEHSAVADLQEHCRLHVRFKPDAPFAAGPAMSTEANGAAASKMQARTEFLEVWEGLRTEILADPMMVQKDAAAWMARMLDHTVPGGKLNRGMAVKDVLVAIKPDASDMDKLQADRLGWAIEFIQAYFLVADDIMDNSITRRGKPCWYREEGVGMVAINDGILLEQLAYLVIRKHLKSHAAYGDLLDLFLQTTHQTAHGQLLDLITAPIGKVDLTRYTLERCLDIMKFKTAYYTFYLPIACGLHLSGITDPQAFATVQSISEEMGLYFQIQDDYLDCYADPEVLGKIGTDIQDNKCGWLMCSALQIATPEQREILSTNYGRDEEACIQKVKAVYAEMELEDKFKEYEAESYAKLTGMIQEQSLVPPAVFTDLLKKIYKRTK